MQAISTEELFCLEVINLCTGERLGSPYKVEFDIECQRILSISVLPDDHLFSLFCQREELVIPWSKVECIGADAILVKLTDGELCSCRKGNRRKKHK